MCVKPDSEKTTEELIALEQFLYDCEVEGMDTWFERDKVLWELNSRDDYKRLMDTSGS